MFDKKYIFEYNNKENNTWKTSIKFTNLEDFWYSITLHLIKGDEIRIHKNSDTVTFN